MGKDITLETKFVYPWVGVIANLNTDVGPNKSHVGKSRAALRDELMQRGFQPTKAEIVWDYRGHSGFGIVEFGGYLDGFKKAIDFERKFSMSGHGKTEYQTGSSKDLDIYGWVAKEEDYLVSGPVGKRLRNGAYDLKTVKQLSEEGERKLKQLVQNLPPSIDIETYYAAGIVDIRTNEAKYESILLGGGDPTLEEKANPGEMVGSSGDHSDEDDHSDDDDDSSDDEDVPKKKKIRR